MPWFKNELNEDNYKLCPQSQFDWWTLHTELDENFMRRFADKLNWRKVSDHQKNLTEEFIREFADKVHWDRITQRIQMSMEFIDEFKDKVEWDYVWSYQRHINCDFIENHLSCCKKVGWDRIVMYQRLTTDFMMKYIDNLTISSILEYQKPKKEMMEFLKARIDCMSEEGRKYVEESWLCRKLQKFTATEEEILKYIAIREKRGWGGNGWWIVTENQKLSEEFIEKNYNRIKADLKSLDYIWEKQKLSEEFLKKHEKDVKWYSVNRNKKIKKTAWIEEQIDKFYKRNRK